MSTGLAFQPTAAVDPHLHCPVDDWTFDARVTEGRCPICGWAPDGVVVEAPEWVRFMRWVDWDIVGLVSLIVVAIILGVIVSRSVHLTWQDLSPLR
jgi:hypothetical protein